MTKLETALELAALGYHVFPLESNSKLPHIEAFPERASTDPETIRRWWIDPVLGWEQDFNIGISTSKFGVDSSTQALLVIDVDNKGEKHGTETLLGLEMEGLDFPATAEANTPTGGKHIIYTVARAVSQGTDVLGDGLDTRSSGGYIVAAGSTIDGAGYAWHTNFHTPVRAPDALVARCGVSVSGRAEKSTVPAFRVDESAALDRAIAYATYAEPAVEGNGGDDTTYRTACAIKDFGVSETQCVQLLEEHWNPRCLPPWDITDLTAKVKNAYHYGSRPIGAVAADIVFAGDRVASDQTLPVESANASPFEMLNREFAFVLAGGGSHVLWETYDEHGQRKLEHLGEGAFHRRHASWEMTAGKKTVPVTEEWMRWKGRRSFDGLCFMPGLPTPKRFYNLWRGFAVEPAEKYTLDPGVEAFLEHIRENVCHGDEKLSHWTIGFFAHMVQRPWEKPLVALVFRGSKGVGKGALVARIGHLLGGHFLSAANRRYLVSQFNGHLENCLFMSLDEAFWSGDKQAEGVLKDLITGEHHVIEHKGKEPYKVDNRTRVAIIGNEDWIVPASHDERRFAVFDVGEGRKQDRDFFRDMRVSMERGGYRHLLRFLLDYDIRGLDFNEAPTTGALLEQKHESLEPLHQWWLECLTDGRFVGGDFDEAWPPMIETGRFREAFRRYIHERNIRSRIPDTRIVGKILKKCAPSLVRKRVRIGEALSYVYTVPSLQACRAEWDAYIGHPVEWD